MYFLFLYAMLADPVFEVRESASDRILALVDRHPDIYGPRLIALAKESTEPEVRARVRRPINVYQRWRVVSYVPKTVPVWPCVDMMPKPLPIVGDIRCRERGRKAYDDWHANPIDPGHWPAQGQLNQGPYWHNYRAATERMARAMIRDGADASEVDFLLLRMWRIENAAKSDCADKWPESSQWNQWLGGYPQPQEPPK